MPCIYTMHFWHMVICTSSSLPSPVTDDDSDAEDQKEKLNSCNVVWEVSLLLLLDEVWPTVLCINWSVNLFLQGKVQDRCFPDWKIKGFPAEGLAREHLKRHGVEHYWDLALSETIVEEED